MAFRNDVPPHLSAQRGDDPAPVDEARPNPAMLKGDIDAGRAGDKVEVFDPGMAMLGTCEEAGGNALSPVDIARARRAETRERWRWSGRKPGYAHRRSPVTIAYFGGFIAAAGTGMAGLIWYLS
ncbi:conserved hypothetical protein [Methylobacterium sp. 4-46]|uniref:hypothetical protein n=1 Tax=unclassified Methylobacterium TaxID=2615210 RepID=UPI000152D8D7|nr:MULTISPECIES: hypothetical protein [Methylobacterium]ACA15128.1 conserved hypothetical protein [Methylobacterium sp. 4-46]WFT80861.1 hypothetical protein QA634_02870 [Methylobacterium nodulans]